ncbi:hypothetical protein PI124_g14865 [Phytophthora idaei]|nr:hypothetical protein PI124_g14865 [Phytophthora idaei]
MGQFHSIEASPENIPELVVLLTSGRSSQKKKALADDEANQGIAPLIALIRDGNPVQKEEAAGVLAALTTTRDNQAAVAATGGIFDLLVDLVRNGTFAERNHALTALKALSVRDKSKEVIAATGAIPVLGMLLVEGNDSQKVLVNDILWSISTIPDIAAIAGRGYAGEACNCF